MWSGFISLLQRTSQQSSQEEDLRSTGQQAVAAAMPLPKDMPPIALPPVGTTREQQQATAQSPATDGQEHPRKAAAAAPAKQTEKRKQLDTPRPAPSAAKRTKRPAEPAAAASAEQHDAAALEAHQQPPAPQAAPVAAAAGTRRGSGAAKPKAHAPQPPLEAVRTSARRAAKLHPAGISSRGRPRKPKADPDAAEPPGAVAAATAASQQLRQHVKAPAVDVSERAPGKAQAASAAKKIAKRRRRPVKEAALTQLAAAQDKPAPAAAGHAVKHTRCPPRAAEAVQTKAAGKKRVRTSAATAVTAATASPKRQRQGAKSAAAVGRQQEATASEPKEGKAAAASSRIRRPPRKGAAANVAGQSKAAAGGQLKAAASVPKRQRSKQRPKPAAAAGAVEQAKAETPARPKKASKQKPAAAPATAAVRESKAEAPAQSKKATASKAARATASTAHSGRPADSKQAAAGKPAARDSGNAEQPVKRPTSKAPTTLTPVSASPAAAGVGPKPGTKSKPAQKAPANGPKARGRPSFLKGLPHLQELVAGGDTPASSSQGSQGSGRRGGLPLDGDYPRCLSRIRHNVYRIRREMGAIEVLEAEGWRGSARDTVKQTAELESAQRQVEKSKLLIREAIKACEDAGGTTAIPESAYDANGELHIKDIFCCVCNGKEEQKDNDIILCDGPCNRAYHEQCLDPPLKAADLPADESWLCPACSAKDQALDLLNLEFGFAYELETPWHAVFAEAAAPEGDAAPAATAHPAADTTTAGANGKLGWLDAQLPSDEEDDSDFEGSNRRGDGGESDGEAASSGAEDSAGGGALPSSRQARSAGGAAAAAGPGSPQMPNSKQRSGGGRGGDGGGGGGRGRANAHAGHRSGAADAADADADSRSGSDSEGGDSMVSEALGPDGVIEDIPVRAGGEAANSDPDIGRGGSGSETDPKLLIVPGRRVRKAVDYKKLNAEMFGDYEAFDGEGDAEEEWGPNSVTPRYGSGRGRSGGLY